VEVGYMSDADRLLFFFPEAVIADFYPARLHPKRIRKKRNKKWDPQKLIANFFPHAA
jgi:hypothetical protein